MYCFIIYYLNQFQVTLFFILEMDKGGNKRRANDKDKNSLLEIRICCLRNPVCRVTGKLSIFVRETSRISKIIPMFSWYCL